MCKRQQYSAFYRWFQRLEIKFNPYCTLRFVNAMFEIAYNTIHWSRSQTIHLKRFFKSVFLSYLSCLLCCALSLSCIHTCRHARAPGHSAEAHWIFELYSTMRIANQSQFVGIKWENEHMAMVQFSFVCVFIPTFTFPHSFYLHSE